MLHDVKYELYDICEKRRTIATPSPPGPSLSIYYSIQIFSQLAVYKSIAGRYRPVSYPDGPITARYRFIMNAYWAVSGK